MYVSVGAPKVAVDDHPARIKRPTTPLADAPIIIGIASALHFGSFSPAEALSAPQPADFFSEKDTCSPLSADLFSKSTRTARGQSISFSIRPSYQFG